MSLTRTEIDKYFHQAKRNGMNTMSPYCDSCGKRGCGEYALAHRQKELSLGHFDPGNLCAVCAEINERLVGQIIAAATRSEH